MTPLEAMVKAMRTAGNNYRRSRELHERSVTDEYGEMARAALLALAECDIPVGDDGLQVEIPMLGKMPMDKPGLMAFRAILRSIATEGKDD